MDPQDNPPTNPGATPPTDPQAERPSATGETPASNVPYGQRPTWEQPYPAPAGGQVPPPSTGPQTPPQPPFGTPSYGPSPYGQPPYGQQQPHVPPYPQPYAQQAGQPYVPPPGAQPPGAQPHVPAGPQAYPPQSLYGQPGGQPHYVPPPGAQQGFQAQGPQPLQPPPQPPRGGPPPQGPQGQYPPGNPVVNFDHSLVTSAFELPAHTIVRNYGLVRGIIVRSRSIFGQIGASFQQMAGGNISIYTELCERARMDAYEIMIQHAAQLGANAVIGVRYDATDIVQGVTEVLCYGTAVAVVPSRQASQAAPGASPSQGPASSAG